MAGTKPSIAVLGAGIGGLAVAACLRKAGIETTIYEQAQAFARIGAGIQMSPNATKVLNGIGVGDRIRATAFRPPHWRNRDHDTGKLTNEHPLGAAAEGRYGTPYLLMHRGDLHASLHGAVPDECIRYDHKIVGIDQSDAGVTMRFENGESVTVDAVIASDGVHSVTREWMLGAEAPVFTGRAAYRTTFPASLLDGRQLDDSCKWWGPDRHIVIYYVTSNRDEIYFTTSQPEEDWQVESWSARGDLGELRDTFRSFHPDVRSVLEACPAVYKWALFERDPLPKWCEGNVTLMGDACHPMVPYMAQGAASALEDAVVLSRCLADGGLEDIPAAFRRFEAARRERTSIIQATSHKNEFMRQATDPDWVYGYDAWNVELPPL
ncbi:MAG: FAD-dependent monooxygenase [Rhodospirillaceae bacterium]